MSALSDTEYSPRLFVVSSYSFFPLPDFTVTVAPTAGSVVPQIVTRPFRVKSTGFGAGAGTCGLGAAFLALKRNITPQNTPKEDISVLPNFLP